MSSFGIVIDVPKRSCAGDAEVVFDGVFLQPRRTKGKALVQVEFFERMRRDDLKVRWKRSMRPLVWGWYDVVRRWLIPSREESVLKSEDSN